MGRKSAGARIQAWYARLVLACLILSTASVADAAIPASERQALIDLYNSTNGPRWTASNWGGNVGYECTWGGVGCDSAQTTVVTLALESNNLRGPLPGSIGNLTNLQYLYLQDNYLSGGIPTQLGNLVHLINLNLLANQLTGRIPSSLMNLTNLSFADFSYNALYADPALTAFLNSRGLGLGNQTIAPTNLSTSGATTSSITVNWSPIAFTDLSGFYQVFYTTTSSGPYTPFFTATTSKSSSSLIVAGLAPGTRYYFVVQTTTLAISYIKTNRSELSAEVSGRTLGPAPTISSVVPATVPTTGTGVTINGTNFVAGAQVDFCGTLVTSTFGSSSQLTAVAPPHAAAVCILRVVNPDGQSASIPNFTYVDAPTITSISPTSGPATGGTAVTIKGTGFFAGQGFPVVDIGGIPQIGTVFDSQTITAVALTHAAGTVSVSVTTPGGQAILPNAFTYYAAPTIASVTPAAGPTSGGTAVTITGTNFTDSGPAGVTFGGAGVTGFIFVSSTQLNVTTPPHAAGPVDVKVTNPRDGQSATLPNGFTYTSGPAPTITSVSPAVGPPAGGSAVTINGTNFASAATVTFGGASAGATFFDATKIIAITPPHTAGSVDVVVTNPDGQRATLPGGFAYVSAIPTITSISPISGPPTGGTAVTINGTNFASGAGVTFGGASAGATFFDSTKIVAVTPAHAEGSADVVVTNSDGGRATLTNGFTYGSCTPPSITAHPQSATITSGQSTTLTVAGSGTGLVSLQWYIGSPPNTSSPVSGGTNPSLTVSPTTTTTYWVRVTDQCGTADSRAATVTVTAACTPPSITAQPKSTTITSGQSTTLSVTAAGSTPLTYQWYIGSSGNTANLVSGETNSSISVRPTSTTTYWVRVTGQCTPAADSATATVTVSQPGSTVPTITSISPTSGPIAGGTSVTINGSNFVSGATVSFGGTASANVTFVSASQLRANTPPHGAGAVSVTVTNPDGQNASLPSAFTYTEGAVAVLTFTADRTSLNFGESTKLRWTTANASFVTISGVGALSANGSVDVTPRDTTRYVITAYSSATPATATGSVTISVTVTRAIISFVVNPSQIRFGEQATLSWGTVRANSVSIDQGEGQQLPPTGSKLIKPLATTTYTLTAFGGPNGTETATTTVSVIATTPPSIISFTANPSQIIEGQSSTLIWSSSGGTIADIDNGVNTVPTAGTFVVRPRRTTIYALWVKGSSGTTTKTVTVFVGPKRPPDIGTLAGSGGVAGADDGSATRARFRTPWSIAVDSRGNTIVADSGNNTVRRISPDGKVETIAGNPGEAGSKDGRGRGALFNFEFYGGGVATDPAGNIYVSDTSNNTIRKITLEGNVTTIAGSAGDTPGYADGLALEARFNSPTHLAVTSNGTIYVADTSNHTIRKISPDGTVSTLAGVAGIRGYTDGPGGIAKFNLPHGLALDAAGNLYVGDVGNDAVRKITPEGEVTTLAGGPNVAGKVMTNGNTSTTRFNFGCCGGGLAMDAEGLLFVADRGSQTIRTVTAEGEVSTVAGSGTKGTTDGPAPDARFNNPIAVATDNSGRLFIADTDNHSIRATQVPTTRRRAVKP
jgi:hypothetical protein